MNQGSVVIAVLGLIFLMSWVIGRVEKRRLDQEFDQIERVTEVR